MTIEELKDLKEKLLDFHVENIKQDDYSYELEMSRILRKISRKIAEKAVSE